jgi:predicted transposase YbfD/YdcC
VDYGEPCGIAVQEKSKEITAFPKILSTLVLNDAVVTIDAMGCQTAIAKQIIENNGDYVLAVKANQPQLHNDVKDFFEEAQKTDYEYTETTDGDHGRIEPRKYYLVQDLETIGNKERWKGLAGIGLVVAKRKINGKETTFSRFLLPVFAIISRNFARLLGNIGALKTLYIMS